MIDPIKISFENIEELRSSVDQKVFSQAVGSTVKQLSDKAGTLISQEVRKKYPVKAGTVKAALRKRFDNSSQVPARLLIYAASRISLRHFATASPKPVVISPRGKRRGAKVKDRKDLPARIVPGGFWGKGGGTEQIYKRKGRSRKPIEKLTGPSVSQMVRGSDVLDAIQKHVEENANPLLRKNLDHFQKRRIGVR